MADKTYVVTELTDDGKWVARHHGPFADLLAAQKFIEDNGLRGVAAAGFLEEPPPPRFDKSVFDFKQSIGRWVVTVEQRESAKDPITSPKAFEKAARNVCARVAEGCRDAEVS